MTNTHEKLDGTFRSHDGTTIAYRMWDDGPGRPLVLLHGGGANLVSMEQYAERLGDGRRTVALDARCCGQSGDPVNFRWADAAGDVATAVRVLDLGSVDVVGHSMGGFVGGFFATDHPDARLVSIDGFGPGMPTTGTGDDHTAFSAFQAGMRSAFWEMTEEPETGDRAWRDREVEALTRRFPAVGYTAPNGAEMAERNLVDLGDGMFRRHPSRLLFTGGFADGGTTDILRMYRDIRGSALLIRCTESGAPAILDRELDQLAATNGCIKVTRIATTHLGPAWDAIDPVSDLTRGFLTLP